MPGAGVIGIETRSRAVPHALGSGLIAALAPARCVDCSALLAGGRIVKSRLELDCLRRAGGYADVGLRAALTHARPGISKRTLAAEIEYAMRRAGSDYPSIPTELSSGSRSVLAHGTPGHRVLEAGDLVHVEIGGVEARYNAVGLQTLHVGGAPPPRAGLHLYAVAQACLRAGLDAIRPGVQAREVEAPALAILRDAGLGDGFKMRFGYGVGVGYPPTWLDPLQITRTSTQPLTPGTTFVLHACLLDEQAQVGVVVGDVRGRRGRCRDARRRGRRRSGDSLTTAASRPRLHAQRATWTVRLHAGQTHWQTGPKVPANRRFMGAPFHASRK